MPHRKDHKIRVEDVFWQSPIPKRRREPTDEEFNAIFNRRAREHREGLLGKGQQGLLPPSGEGGSFFDWLIPAAEGSERVGLMPRENANLFNVDALQEIKDRKLSPVEQLADTEFRAQLNPQGIARFSDAYRNPSKYTSLAYYNAPSDIQGFFIDTGAVTSKTLFDDPEEAEKVVPDQVFWPGRSYQVSTELDQSTVPRHWAKQNPEDVIHHEAAHDAIHSAAKSEFMSGPYKELYAELDSNAANVLGVQISEALARYHDFTYPKSEYARVAARNWFYDELMKARDNSREYPRWGDSLGRHSAEVRRLWERYEELLQSHVIDEYSTGTYGHNKLAEMYNAIEAAAKKRHKSLGYK